ncbi:hypothetical protein KAR91_59145 [Candidatus Pacearchaeota archaeon]|nr:hypothetical protein [Candidatus Pacearchaeota archaeon]
MDFYGIDAKDDITVPGDTLFVGTGQIKSTTGNIELLDTGTKVFETTTTGIQITGNATTARMVKDVSGNLNIVNESIEDDLTLYVTNGSSVLESVFRGIEGGAAELYYDGVKVAETTANGITNPVWG